MVRMGSPVQFRSSAPNCGDIAQLGERVNGIHEVRGSIPLISTKEFYHPSRAFPSVGGFFLLKNSHPTGFSIRRFANDIKVSVLTIKRVYDELEKEGFTNSQVGIGTFVATGNVELIKESKRHMVEKEMQKMIHMSKSLGIAREELFAMMDILYEED